MARSEPNTKPLGGESTEPVMKQAMDYFRESQDGTDYNRNQYYLDIRFGRMGHQWPDDIRSQRQLEGRPVLTINRLPAFIRQIVNDARLNQPSIHVRPVDNVGDDDTAEVIGGLIRSIERGSNADYAYDTAIDLSVSGGFGFFYIDIEWAHEESFDLECVIKRVPNSLMVHYDPSGDAADASDWRYGFVTEWWDREEFKRIYPNAEPSDFTAGSYEDNFGYGVSENLIRLATYWQREECTHKILLLSDGNVIRDESFTDEARALLEVSGVEVARERTVMGHKVMKRRLSGAEVLEEEAWPGSTIPICPVWGDEVIIDGRRWYHSMIRYARDSQTMYNYWRTAATELVALAPKSPFIGKKGFVPDGDERKWETANTRSHPYLEYEGEQPPQRQPFASLPPGAVNESSAAADDMKATLGIFEAGMGMQGNEQSGIAIANRQREGDVSNFHFIDNLNRAIRYAGQCLVEIIPHVYGPRQSIRILGPDNAEKVVNLVHRHGNTPAQPGKDRLYDLSVGKYDVSVKAGPSFTTQREETREALTEIISRVPGAAPMLGDKLLEMMDFPGAEEVAQRLKMLLPPEVREAETGEDFENLPPEAKQALMAQKASIEQLTRQLQEYEQALNDKTTLEQATMTEANAKQAETLSKDRDREFDNGMSVREQDLKESEFDLDVRKQQFTEQQAQAKALSEALETEDRAVTESSMQGAAAAIAALAEVIRMTSEQTSQQNDELLTALTAPRAIEMEKDGAGRVTGGVAVAEQPGI